MVTKCEIIYFIISISDKRQSSFFMSLILSFSFTVLIISSFFPYLVCFNLLYLSRTCTFFLQTSGRNFLYSFWLTFLSRTFFPGGGGACAPSAPPCIRACTALCSKTISYSYILFRSTKEISSHFAGKTLEKYTDLCLEYHRLTF